MIVQERIFRRFTWVLSGVELFSYEERLGLWSLEVRSLRGDMIEL